jgi:DNA-binding transcriptional MerR regulator/methylmalonyl-CoA mutase cobalamin-binding subunit
MDYDMKMHPIGFVSRRTGLSTHAIRAWELRYNAVTPGRTDSDRRLYSESDIDRLELLRDLSNTGLSIGQTANRSTAELRQLADDLSESVPKSVTRHNAGTTDSDVLASIMRECQSSIESMDAHALEATLMRSRVALSDHSVLEELVGPLMSWIGERWHEGMVRASEEHLATVVVKSFLIRMRTSYAAKPDAPVIVVSTPAGELHEVGALLVATASAIEGWNEFYFGPNLPATELANAASQKGARVLALSIAAPGDSPRLSSELMDLRQMLPDSNDILVGGEGAIRHSEFLEENRMRLIRNLSEFRVALRDYRRSHHDHSTKQHVAIRESE